MANNRIQIICKVCQPDLKWTIKSKGRCCLTKYYPSTGWYIVYSIEDLDKFFQEHTHYRNTFGGNNFIFQYEVESDD